MSSSKFPSDGIQFFAAFVQFIGITILTHCLSRRVACERLTSLRHIKNMPFARVALLLLFLDSWMFVFSSSLVIFGVGLERSLDACTVACYLCSFFYATSKAVIYFFLVEKIYIVWQPMGGQSRLHSPLYLWCMVSATGYLALFILLIIARGPVFFDRQGMCRFAIEPLVTWSLLGFDLYINVLLTALFVIPLWRFHSRTNYVLRKVSRRTLAAAFVSLSVSTANILALTLMHGKQRAWLCLTTCTLDILINALAVFWAMMPAARSMAYDTKLRTSDGCDMPEFAKPHESVMITSFGTEVHSNVAEPAVQKRITIETRRLSIPVRFRTDSRLEAIPEQDIGTLKSADESDDSLCV